MLWANRKRVVMTGFSPFRGYEINPSWEGVKSMNGREIEKRYDLTLFRKEIDVSYDEVDRIVPQLWHNYQPHLTIHVGLKTEVEHFVLEKKASKRVYTEIDNNERTPKGYKNACPGPDVLQTDLDVDKICHKFNHNKRKLRDDNLHAVSSDNAGKFICEYIYYTSLCVGPSPSLFVHVPFDKYTSEQLADGLERILELCLIQLHQKPTWCICLRQILRCVRCTTDTIYN